MSLTKSSEWVEKRRKRIGGSEVASILGISPYRSAYDLWMEKTGKKEPEDLSNLPHIIRGHLGEETCRMIIEQEMLKAFRPKMWNHPTLEYIGASDDGWNIDDNILLEIKCMGKANHARAAAGEIPPHYACQCQYNLYVSQAVKCLFISFRPEDGTKHVIEVFPDPKEQERIVAAVSNFWLNNVLKDIPPPIADGDYREVKDEALQKTIQEFKDLHAQSKIIEAKIEECKSRLRPYVSVHHAVVCSGVKLLLTTQQGRIDYKRYAADGKVSNETLEKYRGKPVESFRVFIPASEILV
jgi:putative phage-type endonuclease